MNTLTLIPLTYFNFCFQVRFRIYGFLNEINLRQELQQPPPVQSQLSLKDESTQLTNLKVSHRSLHKESEAS